MHSSLAVSAAVSRRQKSTSGLQRGSPALALAGAEGFLEALLCVMKTQIDMTLGYKWGSIGGHWGYAEKSA